jgi:hypothetical protein
MKRAKRFSEGDEVEYFGSSIGKSESAPAASSSESSTKSEAPAKRQSFSEAFKGAENGSTFEWQGKQYKKEYASDKKSTPKSESAPSKPTPKAEEPAKPAPKAEESKRGIGPHNVFAGPSDKEKADTYAKYAENREKMGGSSKPSGSGKISDSDWAKSVRSSQAAAESDGESLGRKFRKAMGSSYAKGGSVSSASSRGDGIAQRGKTRGKMC